MHTFKDAKGDEWSIELDTTMTREIRKELGVDLLSMDQKTAARLIGEDSESIETLVDMLSIICTNQIKRRELDARGFASRLVGDTIDDACEALVQELVFISRRSRKQVVAKAWEKTRQAEKRLTDKAMDLLDSEMLDQKVEEAMAEMEARLGSL